MLTSSNNHSRPLFIVGMPRSGTKLLRAILNQHSMIAIPDVETEFFPFWVANWARFGDLSSFSNFEGFYLEFMSYPFYGYLQKRGTEIDPTGWYESCTTYSPADVFESLIKLTARFVHGKHVIWGDKSPSYLLHMGLLREHFPTARYIHIVRDVRDYCLSINRAWGKSMLRAAQRWNDDVGSAHRTGGLGDGDYLEIRYEDLLNDPAAESVRVCRFLDVPFEPAIVQLSAITENLGDASGHPHILRSNTRKYISGLEPRIRRKIERIAIDTLRTFDYEYPPDTTSERVPRLQLGFLKIFDGLNLLKATLKSRGIVESVRFLTRYSQITGNRQKFRS